MPAKNVTQQLIDAHLTSGSLTPDEGIALPNPQDLDSLQTGDVLHLADLHHALKQTRPLLITVNGETQTRMEVEHGLPHRNLEAVLAGSLINLFKKQAARHP